MRYKTACRHFVVLLISVISVFVTGCKKDDTTSSDNNIKVGVLLGFSGTGIQNAIETKAALDICLEEVNDYIHRNGLDASVELIFEDTESDSTEAKIKAQSLIDKGVRLIIGPYTSSETMAVKKITDNRDVLLVSHSAVSTSLAIPGDNLLRFVPSDTYQAEAINAMFTSDSVMAIIPVVRNDLWSNSLITATSGQFESNGGVIISQQSFEPGTSDFSSVVAGVMAGIATGISLYGADKIAVYLISYADGADFLEELGNAGLTTGIKIYGASAFAQSSTLIANNTAAEFSAGSNLQCPVFGFDEAASNIYEPIQSQIISLIGTKASIYAFTAYDILWTTVLSSLTQQINPDFATFKAHFIETAGDYYGATGRTELDENGDRKHVYYDFWTVRNDNGIYSWQLSAKYHTTDHILIKY